MKDSCNTEKRIEFSHCHSMPFGTQLLPHGGVRFRLWAPGAKEVALCLISKENISSFSAMEKLPGGWFQADNNDASAGSLYRFRIDDNLLVPDPVSRFQPIDINGSSKVIDPAEFDWTNHDWQGRPWEEVILYELHVGTFSPEGTFAGVEAKLDYLAELGITAIELMPVAAFAGKYNWGYDGVLLFAPTGVYGHPDDLKRLVLKAHRKGIMVILDVVYNHFGNEGNYLYVYAKEAFFQEDTHTPWGVAINFSGPDSRTVRDFFIHNALYWLEEFQLDGLRFDAVHGIHDNSQPHILEEIAEAVAQGPGKTRHIHLILENDNNEAHYLGRKPNGIPKHFTAQWNDDIHHALHVLLTDENEGYYQDYADKPIRHLARCLTEGFAYQGEPSPYRHNTYRGEISRMLPPTAFVSFLQNHDQIGNRALGERLCTMVEEQYIRLAASLLLLAPQPPLLFMGEEFLATTPFYYFCDFEEILAQAVTEGRRHEFSLIPQSSAPELLALIPDPCSPETFQQSCLSWENLKNRSEKQGFSFYKTIINTRKQFIAPRLKGIEGEKATYRILGPKALDVRWTLGDYSQLCIIINFGEKPLEGNFHHLGHVIYEDPKITDIDFQQQTIPAKSIRCLLEDSK